MNRVTQWNPCKKGRVLVADDHDVTRILLKVMLQNLGWEVVLAENGRLAVDLVRQSTDRGVPYALALLGTKLPLCDGYAVTRNLRRIGFDRHELPIVAIASRTDERELPEVRMAGMQDCLIRPSDFASEAPRPALGHTDDQTCLPSTRASHQAARPNPPPIAQMMAFRPPKL